MSTVESPAKALMTAEEFWALPDDGISKELIRGELQVNEPAIHTAAHGIVVARLACLLVNWIDMRPRNSGEVGCGGGGFLLRSNPDTLVGIDVAYASAELVANTRSQTPYYNGPPALAVEVLSPADDPEWILDKVSIYLEAGSVVWLVDPDSQTVSVHAPGKTTQTFRERQEINGDPYLPGFRVAVSEFFED